MHWWRGIEAVPAGWGRSVATIGVFDGVHRGHQRVIRRAVDRGRAAGLPVVVVTFEPHPVEVLRPGTHPDLLVTQDHKRRLLAELGVDAVLVLAFTRDFSRLEPDEFVQSTLVDAVAVAAVVVGENFRFGHKAAGDVDTLRQLAEKYDFEVEGVPLAKHGVGALSSTRIRELIAEGDVTTAAAGLGRPHQVEGQVVRGHDRGSRLLGFPTANLDCPPHTAIPGDGVYAGWLTSDDGRLPAAISVGTNPQFDDAERSVEAHALDRDDLDLYGQRVTVEFVSRLRDTVRFDSVAELSTAIRGDVERTRTIVRSP